jgi:hypothetical protein
VRVEEQGSASPARVAAGKSRRQVSEAQLNQLLASLSEENLPARSRRPSRRRVNSSSGSCRSRWPALPATSTRSGRDTELVLASIEELDRKSESKFRETDQAIDALLESVQTQEPK